MRSERMYTVITGLMNTENRFAQLTRCEFTTPVHRTELTPEAWYSEKFGRPSRHVLEVTAGVYLVAVHRRFCENEQRYPALTDEHSIHLTALERRSVNQVLDRGRRSVSIPNVDQLRDRFPNYTVVIDAMQSLDPDGARAFTGKLGTTGQTRFDDGVTRLLRQVSEATPNWSRAYLTLLSKHYASTDWRNRPFPPVPPPYTPKDQLRIDKTTPITFGLRTPDSDLGFTRQALLRHTEWIDSSLDGGSPPATVARPFVLTELEASETGAGRAPDVECGGAGVLANALYVLVGMIDHYATVEAALIDPAQMQAIQTRIVTIAQACSRLRGHVVYALIRLWTAAYSGDLSDESWEYALQAWNKYREAHNPTVTPDYRTMHRIMAAVTTSTSTSIAH